MINPFTHSHPSSDKIDALISRYMDTLYDDYDLKKDFFKIFNPENDKYAIYVDAYGYKNEVLISAFSHRKLMLADTKNLLQSTFYIRREEGITPVRDYILKIFKIFSFGGKNMIDKEVSIVYNSHGKITMANGGSICISNSPVPAIKGFKWAEDNSDEMQKIIRKIVNILNKEFIENKEVNTDIKGGELLKHDIETSLVITKNKSLIGVAYGKAE